MGKMEDFVTVSTEGKLQIIKLNRPKKRNAISLEMYKRIREALAEAADNDEISMTVITGEGEYFSSGNDFGQSMTSVGDEDMDEAVRQRVDHVRLFIKTLIDHPKILVAVINGPAIGVAVTMLSLFDIVYAVDTATFETPFGSLAICGEGCSTYTFPRQLGKSVSAEMLYFNRKLNAEAARSCGLVAEVVPKRELPKVFAKLREYSEVPLNSLLASKRLVRAHDYNSLHLANSLETEELIKRFKSEEFMSAVLAKLMKKSKL